MTKLTAVNCPITHETKFVSLAEKKYDVTKDEHGEIFAISKDEEERLRKLGNRMRGCFSATLFILFTTVSGILFYVSAKEHQKNKQKVICTDNKKANILNSKEFYEFSKYHNLMENTQNKR